MLHYVNSIVYSTLPAPETVPGSSGRLPETAAPDLGAPCAEPVL